MDVVEAIRAEALEQLTEARRVLSAFRTLPDRELLDAVTTKWWVERSLWALVRVCGRMVPTTTWFITEEQKALRRLSSVLEWHLGRIGPQLDAARKSRPGIVVY